MMIIWKVNNIIRRIIPETSKCKKYVSVLNYSSIVGDIEIKIYRMYPTYYKLIKVLHRNELGELYRKGNFWDELEKLIKVLYRDIELDNILDVE